MSRLGVLSVLLLIALVASACSDDSSSASITTAAPVPTSAPTVATSASETSVAPSTTRAVASTTTSTAAVTTVRVEPTRIGSYDVVVEEDIPYTTDKQIRDPMLDVYRPAVEGTWPTVVWLHGGAQSRKSMATVVPMVEAIASMGAVVFVPSWGAQEIARGSFDFEAPAAACAVRFAATEAVAYGGDRHHLIVAGHSAGGLLGLSTVLRGDALDVGSCVFPDGDPLAPFFVGNDVPPLLEYERWGVGPELMAVLDPTRNVDANPGLRLWFVASFA